MILPVSFLCFRAGVSDQAIGADCFTKANWPKLIGYGTEVTSVSSIDRKNDGKLALGVSSKEPHFGFNTSPNGR